MSHRPILAVFLRRRSVVLPTVWGAMLLLAALSLGSLVLARSANAWFAPSQPVRSASGQGAPTLVVEGWVDSGGLDQAVRTFRAGGYARVITTGGPLESWPPPPPGIKNYAELAATYLKQHGLADDPVFAVPAPASLQDRTFLSAVMVRDWSRRNGTPLVAIDLFSGGVHARRSWMVYRMVFEPAVAVGVLATRPGGHDPDHWWHSSQGAKALLGEAISLGWTVCCFWPPAAGSHEERWAVPKPASAP